MKTSWRHFCKTSWRCLEDVLKTSSKRLDDVLKMSWRLFFKTSWRYLEDVLKMSWRCFEDVLGRCMSRANMFFLVKTSSPRRRFAGLFSMIKKFLAVFTTYVFTYCFACIFLAIVLAQDKDPQLFANVWSLRQTN